MLHYGIYRINQCNYTHHNRTRMNCILLSCTASVGGLSCGIRHPATTEQTIETYTKSDPLTYCQMRLRSNYNDGSNEIWDHLTYSAIVISQRMSQFSRFRENKIDPSTLYVAIRRRWRNQTCMISKVLLCFIRALKSIDKVCRVDDLTRVLDDA